MGYISSFELMILSLINSVYLHALLHDSQFITANFPCPSTVVWAGGSYLLTPQYTAQKPFIQLTYVDAQHLGGQLSSVTLLEQGAIPQLVVCTGLHRQQDTAGK